MSDELERILDQGIASYGDAEPLAGMEERIVARISGAKAPRRSAMVWRAVWVLGLAGMAVAAFVLSFVARHETSRPHSMPVAVALVNRPLRLSIESTPVRLPVRVSKPQRRRPVLPKGPVFPTPSPLTNEERLMVALLLRNPDETAQAFESLRQQGSEPIMIAPLVVPPISTNQGQ